MTHQWLRRTMTELAVLAVLAAPVGCAGGAGDGDDAPRDTASGGGAAGSSGGRTDTTASGGGSGDDSDASLSFPADSGTAGITMQRRDGIEPAILRAVRTASHAEFDRVVFDFGDGRVPGYHTEYIDRPVRQCGSGDVVQVQGDGWLRVRLEPARAHEFRDDTLAVVTVIERNRDLSLPILKQLVLVCDFEAQVEWVAGVASPNRYRVMELERPARLVVDVRR